MIDTGKPGAKELLSEFAKQLPIAVPGKLEGLNLSMFENEKFTTKELRDIANVITVRHCMMQVTPEDIPIYYICGVLIRSIYRGYKEVTDMMDEYSGIVRESDKNKKLASMAAHQNSRIMELEKLNIEKQEKLNASQK